MKVTGEDIVDFIERDGNYYVKCKDNTEYEIPRSVISLADFYFIDGFVLAKMDWEYYRDETLRTFAKYINFGDGIKCKNGNGE